MLMDHQDLYIVDRVLSISLNSTDAIMNLTELITGVVSNDPWHHRILHNITETTVRQAVGEEKEGVNVHQNTHKHSPHPQTQDTHEHGIVLMRNITLKMLVAYTATHTEHLLITYKLSSMR